MRLRLLGSLALVLTFVYFALTRIPRSWKTIVFEPLLMEQWYKLQPDWPQRLIASVCILIFLAILYSFLRIILNAQGRISVVQFFFSYMGLGIVTLEFASILLGDFVGPYLTRVFFALPLLLASAYYYWRFTQLKTVNSSQLFPHFFHKCFVRKRPIVSLLIAVFAVKLLAAVAFLIFIKDQATWDEAYFWWPGTEHLHSFGIHHYFTSYDNRGYDPFYPFISNFFLSIFPSKSYLAYAGGNLLIFCYTASLLVFMFEVISKSWNRYQAFIIVSLLYITLVFTQGGWIYVLSLKVGNGDFPAALVALILFYCSFTNYSAQKNGAPIPYIELAGIAILAAQSKPPMSKLIIPAMAGLAVFTFLFSKKDKRITNVKPTLFLFLGAVVGVYMWKWTSNTYDISSYFSYSFMDLFNFEFTENNRLFLKLSYTDYRVAFALFFCSALLMFIRWHKQSYLFPAFSIMFAFLSSIFVLYMGLWKGIEHESGGRYISQFLVSWCLLYIITEHRVIAAAIRYLVISFKKYILTRA